MEKGETPISVVGFVGFSGSGKTTLAVQVVQLLKERGLRVAVVKHDAHGHYRDDKEKDSGKYVESGADSVIVVSPDSVVRIDRYVSINLYELTRSMTGFDLVVAEGFKQESHPKIAVFRNEQQAEILTNINAGLIAAAVSFDFHHPEVPVFDLNDICSITDFIVQLFEKNMMIWY